MLAVTAGEWIVSAATILSVLIGVFATGWWQRRTFRWEQIERSTQRLAMLLPHVSAVMWEGWQGERNTGHGSQWARWQGDATGLLTEIMVGTRRLQFCSRRAARVETAANDLAARFVAAVMDFSYKRPPLLLSTDRLLSITTATKSLFEAVFGEGRSLTTEIEHHQRQIERDSSQPETP